MPQDTQRHAPKAPPVRPMRQPNVTIPRPQAPAPGTDRAAFEASRPTAPAPITTPNLAGPDALKVDFDELRFNDPAVRKKGFAKLSHKAKIAIYVVCACAVIAAAALLVVLLAAPAAPILGS